MFFYHGTNEVISNIDFSKSRFRTDFGRGFYLSSKLDTAKEWAVGKSGFSGTATVMRYDISDMVYNDTTLNIKRFDEPIIEWLDFIKKNRRRDISKENTPEPRHSFDVIIGPIANDKVADIVDMYCKGRINAEVAINNVKALPNVIQISFHSSNAFKHIKSVSYSQLKKSIWCKWRIV